MNDRCFGTPCRVESAYAQDHNLLFGERIYKVDALLCLHETLAGVIIEAASLCQKRYGLNMVLYDGLRTVEAQMRMIETKRVKDHPHWLEEPRLLSPPGAGGHPRGMAVDVGLETPEGILVDMGTPFDFLAEDAGPKTNPAHRGYKRHHQDIIQNREKLDSVMLGAAEKLGVPLLALPEEWWDFRLPASYYQQYMPLSEREVPERLRLLDTV